MLGPVRKITPKFIRRSYALKFAIVLLVIGLSVGAVGYLGTDQIAGEVQAQAEEDSEQLAEQEARNVENWNENNVLEVQRLASETPAQSDPGIFISAEASANEGFHSIHYIDVEENEVNLSTNGDLRGAQLDDVSEPWGQEFAGMGSSVYQEQTVFDQYDLGELQNEPAIVPHETEDGTEVLSYVYRGEDRSQYLVLSLDLNAYSEEMISDEGRVSFIVNEELGQVTMDPNGEAVFMEYDQDDLDLSAASTAGTSQAIGTPATDGALASSVGSSYSDEPYIASAARVSEGSPWVVAIHTPESQAYGFVQDIQQYGIYASIGGIVLVMLIGGVVGRNTSRSIDSLTSKAERMEDGDLDVELETERIDSIGQLYGGFGNMRDSLKAQIHEAQTARQEAEQARTETERINRHLEAKADEYRDVMQVCADGDLTARMDTETENEAMEEIALEFNEMIAEIEETTGHLKAFANEVATSSEQVTASSEEVRSASEQVTESVQEISDGADRQNESLQSVTHEMNGLSTTIEQIAASSNQVADIAARTANTGERGRDAAQDAIEGMNDIETESEQAVAEIERLEAEMEQIDELIEFITEVAEQTNMLALNANIEAARSGDSGEGFSVVAGEVKELAEETKLAAEDIEERLEQIQEQTERTAQEVQLTSDRVSEHTDSVERAAGALDEIADYAEETNTGVQEISAASEEQAASTQEAVAMVDDAASISEQTSAESENVAAAAEEQTTALTEVSRSAGDLASQASQLSEALDRFDTDAEIELSEEFPLEIAHDESEILSVPADEKPDLELPADSASQFTPTRPVEGQSEEPLANAPAGDTDDGSTASEEGETDPLAFDNTGSEAPSSEEPDPLALDGAFGSDSTADDSHAQGGDTDAGVDPHDDDSDDTEAEDTDGEDAGTEDVDDVFTFGDDR